MSILSEGFLNNWLSKRTSIFGLRLWVVIGILVGATIVLLLFLLSLCFTSRRRSPRLVSHSPTRTSSAKGKSLKLHLRDRTPPVSKDIREIVHHNTTYQLPLPLPQVQIVHHPPPPPPPPQSGSTTGTVSTVSGSTTGTPSKTPEVSHLGWGHWYTLREIEEATNGLDEENVIGEGGYGIVYRGVLPDQTIIAVKNLLNNRGQAEKEFKVEVETIGRVRHKNLVRLLGYCIEGAYRMLVYEYVDNGNLDQWLHGDVGQVSPLTWQIRMNIILGTAKGYIILSTIQYL